MHTEEEAKTKWCPFARTLEKADVHVRADRAGTTDWLEMNAAVAASVNREPWGYDEHGNETVMISGRHRCIGSACMAWQWNDPPTERVEAVIMGHRPDGDGWVCELKDEGREKYSVKSIWVRPNPTRRGYCGLAVRT